MDFFFYENKNAAYSKAIKTTFHYGFACIVDSLTSNKVHCVDFGNDSSYFVFQLRRTKPIENNWIQFILLLHQSIVDSFFSIKMQNIIFSAALMRIPPNSVVKIKKIKNQYSLLSLSNVNYCLSMVFLIVFVWWIHKIYVNVYLHFSQRSTISEIASYTKFGCMPKITTLKINFNRE